MKTIRNVCAMALLGAAAAVAWSNDASAADKSMETRMVWFADLNLSSQAGAQTLYNRIRGAARSACRIALVEMLPLMQDERRKCAQDALADAVSRVDNQYLTAYHLQQTGRREAEKLTARR